MQIKITLIYTKDHVNLATSTKMLPDWTFQLMRLGYMECTFGHGINARSNLSSQSVWPLLSSPPHLHERQVRHQIAFLQTMMNAVLVQDWLQNLNK